MEELVKQDQLLNTFLRSCFPKGNAVFYTSLDTDALNELDEQHFAKAKEAVLNGLYEKLSERLLHAVRAMSLFDAVPVLDDWYKKTTDFPNKTRNHLASLVFTLYWLTKKRKYIKALASIVYNASYYTEFDDGGIRFLSETPLIDDSCSAVWERYKKGRVIKKPCAWKAHCIIFFRKMMKSAVGDAFMKNLPASEQDELLELISENQPNCTEEEKRFEQYVASKVFGYTEDVLNSENEFYKEGKSPIKGMRLKSIWRGHSNKIGDIVWVLEGDFLISAADDEMLLVWNLEKNDYVRILLRKKFEKYSKYVPKKMAWLSDEHELAVIYRYFSTKYEDINNIAYWDIETEEVRFSENTSPEGDEFSYTTDLLYLPSRKSVLIRMYENKEYRLFLSNIFTNESSEFLNEYNPESMGAFSLSPNGKLLAFSYGDPHDNNTNRFQVVIYDIEKMEELYRFNGHLGPIRSICWAPDESAVISGSVDNSIRIWDFSSLEKNLLLAGHRGAVDSLSLSANGELLASKSKADQTVQIWDLKTGQVKYAFRELDGGNSSAIAFHPKLPILATLCTENTGANSIRVWEFDYEVFKTNHPFFDNLEISN